MHSDTRKRRWKLQFSLRTLLLSFIPFALLFGWIGLRMQQARERAAFEEQFQGGYANFTWEDGEVKRAYLSDISNGAKVTDKDISRLSGLKSIVALEIGPAHSITDESIETIGKLTSLRILGLEDTGVTAAGLVHLNSHRNLAMVDLTRTRVGDEALTHLATLPKLEKLWFQDHDITEAGLVLFAEVPQLERTAIKR